MQDSKTIKPRNIAFLPEISTRKIFDNWTVGNLLLFAGIKMMEGLVYLGVRPKEDGFRRYARAFLRGEESRFVLPIFGLDLNGISEAISVYADAKALNIDDLQAPIIDKLSNFFSSHYDLFHSRLSWSRFGVRIVPNHGEVGIVVVEFDENGELLSLSPSISLEPFAERFNRNAGQAAMTEAANNAFISAYNQTRHLETRQRPYYLEKLLKRFARSNQAPGNILSYLEHIASSTWVYFEPLVWSDRIKPPDFRLRRPPGAGMMCICCRYDLENAFIDLWAQFSHALIDGAPAIDLLNAVREQWGQSCPIILPKASYEVLPPSTSMDDETHWPELNMVLSFEQLKTIRRKLNNKYQHLGVDISLASILLWELAKHPHFRNSKFTVMVDLPPRFGLDEPRTSCSVVIRPGKYLKVRDQETAFLSYIREFNQQLNALRDHTAAIFRVMTAFALVPPEVYELCWFLFRGAVSEIVGTPTITILRDADLLIAPRDLTRYGVLAFGNMSMATENGGTGGFVSIRARQQDIHAYQEALIQVVAGCQREQPSDIRKEISGWTGE